MNRDITRECLKYEVLDKEKRDETIRILNLLKDNISKEDKEYYEIISPKLVDAIDKRDDKENIYNDFYNKVICVATKAIKANEYTLAYYFYKTAVIALQEKVLTPELNRELIKTLKASNI